MWNWSEDQIKIVLIRHGETGANRERRYLGKTDEPLSEEGISALREAKRKNLYPDADYLFGSPMKRCIQTAEILYPEQEMFLIPEWEEMDFGDFEGKNYLELQGDERYQKWIDSNGTLPFPNGESRKAFIRRCRQGFEKMLGRLLKLCGNDPKKEMTVVLIIHGGTVMSLLSAFGGGEYFDYRTANGQGYRGVLGKRKGAFRITEIQKLTIVG